MTRIYQTWLAGIGALALVSCSTGGAPQATEPHTVTAADDGSQRAAEGAVHPGREIYNRDCAVCHDQPEITRAPALAALQSLNADHIRLALTDGVMQMQGQALKPDEFTQLVAYLARPEENAHDWIDASMCAANRRGVQLDMAPTVAMYGFDLESRRRMTAQEAGLTSADLKDLEVEWAIAFPQTGTMRAQPVIVGTTLFISVGDTSRVYALDTETACIKWVFVSDTPLRTALTYGEIGPDKRKVLMVGDTTRRLMQLDATTGEMLWEQDIRLFDRSRPTAAPLIYKDRIYMPLSNREASQAVNDNFECCRTHGGVLALDGRTGERIWIYETTPGAILQGVNAVGTPRWGPSGAPIWANPTIDIKRNALYVTTGENFSLPATNTSDAIISLDLDTGRENWVFQGTPNDAWNSSCGADTSGANCPPESESIREDFDFGGAAVLAQGTDGKDILLAGQKSGHVWAVDPDTGALLWSERFGRGTTLGGNHMGVAVDDTRVFVPINDSIRPNRVSSYEPGMNALDITTGRVLWRYRVTPACDGGRKERVPRCDTWHGLSSPPLVIDQSVVASSVDGRMFIFDAASGRIDWEFDTARSFETRNGVEGRGGQIDNGAFVAANGSLFVQSGYGSAPGNVLIKFTPRSRR